MEVKKSDKASLEKKRPIFLQLGLVIVLATVLIAFEWTSRPAQSTMNMELADLDVDEEIIPITRQKQEQPPPPPQQQPQDLLKIVEDDVEIENELIIEDAEADQTMEIEIVEFAEEEEVEEEEVFFIVEDMPSFRGEGQEGFRRYIQQNLRYPQIAQENGIEGKVYVQFAVNSKGEVVDTKVVRGVDPALDKEALRVVMSSPKWEPGRQRGNAVKVQFTFPIVFVLQ